MAILDKRFPFSGRVTVIQMNHHGYNDYTLTISTNKDGIFKGLSILILWGTSPQNVMAKLTYKSNLSKTERLSQHDYLVKELETSKTIPHEGPQIGLHILTDTLLEVGLLESVTFYSNFSLSSRN